jgi:hypothetical protein
MTMLRAVIASEAKQSIAATRLDCFVASLVALTVRRERITQGMMI